MVKKSLISVITQEKEENSGLLNFKYPISPIRYGDLLHIHNCTKEIFLSQRGLRIILGKHQRLLTYLSKKNKMRYKELIDQLDIREPKTR